VSAHRLLIPPLSHGLIGKPRWAVFSIASTCATAAFALRFGDKIAQRPVFYILIHVAPQKSSRVDYQTDYFL
jgi:hypothetical protein